MIRQILEYLSYHPIEYYVYIGIIGLVIGSFLNVVIYRLPKIIKQSYQEECYVFLELPKPEHLRNQKNFNLLFPRSHCPSCHHKIAFWQNIPLISYAILKGKCYYCKAQISFRYPAVEFLTALLFIIVAWTLGVTGATLVGLLLTSCLIIQTFIDMENLIIPDEITLPFLWVAIILSAFNLSFVHLHAAVLGAVAGYLTLYIIYQIFKLVTKKEGFGFGDFKLLAMIGAFLGWQALPLTLFVAAGLGTIFGLGGMIVAKRSKDTPMPFGPYLAIGAYIAMLWGHQINNTYLLYVR